MGFTMLAAVGTCHSMALFINASSFFSAGGVLDAARLIGGCVMKILALVAVLISSGASWETASILTQSGATALHHESTLLTLGDESLGLCAGIHRKDASAGSSPSIEYLVLPQWPQC
jgi:hypothetical protein